MGSRGEHLMLTHGGSCSKETQSTHASDNGHASSQAWANAVGQDSCVPDPYSQTNLVEVSFLSLASRLRANLRGALGFRAD
jgi:hypothetical protein